MIARLEGILIEKSPTYVVIDCCGVGFRVIVSLTTLDALPGIGERVIIHTCFIVRDDAFEIVGFASKSERDAFQLLFATPGIGTRTALNILSAMTVSELQQAVLSNNSLSLQRIPGVGRKTAERLILELREKIGTLETEVPVADGQFTHLLGEALSALLVLGYNRQFAEKVLRAALDQIQSENETPTVELLVKRALRQVHQ